MKRFIPVLAALMLLSGCEYAFSDAATRVRYALLAAQLGIVDGETRVITVDPDHWPEGCYLDSGYRLVLSPYKGGKQVAVGDIFVFCNNGQRYYTGLGSEQIFVSQELSVTKGAGEKVELTLKKTPAGIEITGIK